MVIEKNGNTQECDNNAELDDMAIIEQDAHGEHFLKVLFFKKNRHYYIMDLVVSISQKSST